MDEELKKAHGSEEYRKASENLRKIQKKIEPLTTEKRLKVYSTKHSWNSKME